MGALLSLTTTLRIIMNAHVAILLQAANARSFSYLLPDSIELALYLTLAVYFAIQVGEQAKLA